MQQSESSIGRQEEQTSGWAVGFLVFAVIVMVMVGVFQALIGFTAIWSYAFFQTPEEYPFRFSGTVWGLGHLIVGTLVAFAGIALFSGAVWARTIGVIVAGVSAISNFMAIPNYPAWSILIIALDVFVIWALTVHGRDLSTSTSK